MRDVNSLCFFMRVLRQLGQPDCVNLSTPSTSQGRKTCTDGNAIIQHTTPFPAQKIPAPPALHQELPPL